MSNQRFVSSKIGRLHTSCGNLKICCNGFCFSNHIPVNAMPLLTSVKIAKANCMFVFFALCENTLLIVQRYKINYSGLKIVLSLQRFLSGIKFFNMDIHEYRQLILNELLARKNRKRRTYY